MRKKKEHRNLLGFDGSVIRFFDKMFDILALGFLWILCSLPVFTIGASTTALYYAMVKGVKRQDGYIAREFFKAFRVNLKPALLIWAVLVAVTFLLHLNIGILMAKTSGYVGLFFICLYGAAAIYVFFVSCYVFPALSRFAMSPGWVLKLALYMVVRYLGTTLFLLVLFTCTGILVFKVPMLIFFLPGPVAFIMSDFLERVLKKHEPEDIQKQQNRN